MANYSTLFVSRGWITKVSHFSAKFTCTMCLPPTVPNSLPFSHPYPTRTLTHTPQTVQLFTNYLYILVDFKIHKFLLHVFRVCRVSPTRTTCSTGKYVSINVSCICCENPAILLPVHTSKRKSTSSRNSTPTIPPIDKRRRREMIQMRSGLICWFNFCAEQS